MLFIIDQLKYDTDKMELISCYYQYNYIKAEVKLFRSAKGYWLLTYSHHGSYYYATRLTKQDARNILLKHDYKTYERIFGELEEA